MSNHPNRSRVKGPASNPAPDEIRGVRVELGFTQKQAASLVHTTLRNWQQWEAGDRRMHQAMWELFKIKTQENVMIQATKSIEIRFAGFDQIDAELGNVRVTFDGEEFTFATNRSDRDAEASRPEFDRFVERVVAGDQYDDDNDQHIECAEYVAKSGIDAASRYAEACWAMLDD